jgi:hypothetical protein
MVKKNQVLPFFSFEVHELTSNDELNSVFGQGPREPLKSGRAQTSGQDKQVSNTAVYCIFAPSC